MARSLIAHTSIDLTNPSHYPIYVLVRLKG